jgi:hypothetical protein
MMGDSNANSLFAKLDAAQSALDLGQTGVAINNLKAFVQAVEAQASTLSPNTRRIWPCMRSTSSMRCASEPPQAWG